MSATMLLWVKLLSVPRQTFLIKARVSMGGVYLDRVIKAYNSGSFEKRTPFVFTEPISS